MYDIQSRWKLENNRLQYYGLRNASHLFKNTVKISKRQQGIIQKLPCELTDEEKERARQATLARLEAERLEAEREEAEEKAKAEAQLKAQEKAQKPKAPAKSKAPTTKTAEKKTAM